MSIITPLFIGSVSDIDRSYANNYSTFCCQGNNTAEDMQSYIKVLAPTFSPTVNMFQTSFNLFTALTVFGKQLFLMRCLYHLPVDQVNITRVIIYSAT